MVGLGRAERVDPVIESPVGLASPDLIEKRFVLGVQVWCIGVSLAPADW
jgi:hypothetical protein